MSSNRGRIDGKSVTRHKPERVTWHQGRGAGDGVGMRSSVASKCPRTAQTAGGVATEHRRFGNVKIIAYIRVSTSEQVDSGAGLEAQRSSISAEATRRGWTQVEYIEDAGFSAGSMNRPGLAAALTALEHGEAQLLVVAKMDRLSRSVLDFASIMQKAQREGWVLLALDSPADLTTPGGEAMAGVMAVFAQLERRLIGQRTREALAKRREAGVTLGRPRFIASGVEESIRVYRNEGMTLRQIAARLDSDGVPTASGGMWWASSVHRVLSRRADRGLGSSTRRNPAAA